MRKALPTTTFIVLTILLAFALPSCNEDVPTDLGQEIFEGTENPGANFTDTQSIVATLVRSETIEYDPTLLTAADRPFLLGEISEDPVFGSSFAGIYATIAPLETLGSPGENLRFDSLHLYLDYENVIAYGDTTSLQNLVVYEMDENIDESNLFSDRDFAIKEPEIARATDFRYEPLEPFYLGDDTLDSRLFFDLSEVMRDGELLGEQFTEVLRDSLDSTFLKREEFKEFWKGFYVMPDTSLSNNAMVRINMSSSNSVMVLYFSDLDETEVDNQSRLRAFGVSDTCLFVNRFEHNYAISADQSIQNILESPNQTLSDKAYLQGYGGLEIDIEFPDLASLGNILVNKAELVLTHVHDEDNQDENFAIPGGFNYTYLDDDGEYALTEDALQITAFPIVTVDEASDPVITTYTFNINQHLQNLVNGELPDDVLRVSVSDLIFTNSQEFTPNRVVLSGPDEPNDDLRMKLNLYYTNLP